MSALRGQRLVQGVFSEVNNFYFEYLRSGSIDVDEILHAGTRLNRKHVPPSFMAIPF